MTPSTIPQSTPAVPHLSSARQTPFLPWLILWITVALLEIVLLSFNARADTFLWRTTRWFTGDQDAYQHGR